MSESDGAGSARFGRQLGALASRLGIQWHFWDLLGAEHETSIETARALCAAMGYEAETERRAAESLARLDAEFSGGCVAPARVWREHASARPDLQVRHPGGDWRVRVVVGGPNGGGEARDTRLPGAPAGSLVAVSLPGHFEAGVYDIEFEISHAGESRAGRQRLVVAPRTALRFREKLGDRRISGLWTNLYTVRGRRSWGFGDTGDLRAIAEACGAAGGDFVGVNPLHAVPIRAGSVSPYSPSSRFFRNPLYIDVEAVAEFDGCEGARRLAAAADPDIARLRAANALDVAAVWAQKRPVLQALHRSFRTQATGGRRARFEAFRTAGGTPLIHFATFAALASTEKSCVGVAWPRWPAELRDPNSPSVAAFRERCSDEVAFQVWLQFELDEQLAAVAETCCETGQAIGLYFDLAVGSAADSADCWAQPACHARNVSLGAPPDAYAPEGQVWGLPPFDPLALRREGFETWQRLLAASLRHAGALRIDHVMGLQRQFWIPAGGTPADGAYIRFPLDDLLGVLALESRRHSALVIGEDLGTVPPHLPAHLASWGVLSSSVFVFERRDGGFASSDEISPRAFASVGTHDLAPFSGYAVGRDLDLRRRAGAISSDADLAAAHADRAADMAALVQRLRAEGLSEGGDRPDPAELRKGLAELLGRSPAPLVGISLDDVADENEPINLPGIPVETYPSWARRMSADLEALVEPDRLPEELPRKRPARQGAKSG